MPYPDARTLMYSKHAPGECCDHTAIVDGPEIYPFTLTRPGPFKRFLNWLRRVFL